MNNITLTYLNIRQSIAILLLKLVLTDFILAFIVISFYFVLVQGERFSIYVSQNTTVFLLVFAALGIIKIGISIYVVLQWLFEYYEITPDNIIHRSGIIERKTTMYNLNKVRVMEVKDSFFGELFNYATITLYDIRLNKYLDMYLIHNPQRYANVLRSLQPELEMKTDRISLPFMKKEKHEEGYVGV